MSQKLHDAICQIQQMFRDRAHPTHPVPRIVCPDGFSVSVQASEYAYCQPRINGADFYQEVELGFPSDKVPEWMEYAEQPEKPTDTVYGYIPVELVAEVLIQHGFGQSA